MYKSYLEESVIGLASIADGLSSKSWSSIGDLILSETTDTIQSSYEIAIVSHSLSDKVQLFMADDFADGPTSTGIVIVGGAPVSGVLEVIEDEDWFAITVSKDQIIRFFVERADETFFSYSMDIFSSDGVPVSIANGIQSGEVTLDWVFDEAGTYFVSVHSTTNPGSNGGPSSYTLQATEVIDDFSADENTSGALVLDGPTVSAAIDYSGDRDWFLIEVNSGDIVNFSLSANHKFSSAKSIITLFDSNGVALAQDIESYFEDLDYEFTESGTYFLEISYANTIGDVGTYELSATNIIDDIIGSVDTLHSLTTDGVSVSGAIDYKGDSDWFVIDVLAGQSFTFSISTPTSNIGILLFDAAGVQLESPLDIQISDDDFVFEFAESGRYYIAVESMFLSTSTEYTGNYSLTANIETDDYPGNTSTLSSLTIDGSQNLGEMNFSGDIDWFQLNVSDGQVLEFFMDGTNYQLSRARLNIFDASGNLIGGHPSGSGFNDTTLLYQFNDGGTYYVSASSTSINQSAGYYITVTEFVDDFSNGDMTIGQLIVDGNDVSANRDFEDDTDWFSVEVLAGQSVRFRSTLLASLSILDADSNIVSGDYYTFESESYIEHYFANSGTFYLSVNYFTAATNESSISAFNILPLEPGGLFLPGTNGGDSIVGTEFDDQLSGGNGADELRGFGGNDLLHGGSGEDTLFGGDGNDELRGDSDADILYGNAGDDVLYGGTVNGNLVYGGDGNDVLSGSGELYGEAGNDIIHGGGGSGNFLNGGAGVDTLTYETESRAVTVSLNALFPQLISNIGGARDQVLNIENIIGSDFDDVLTGSIDVNVLMGGFGDDTILGLAGADVVNGGAGNDYIYGGIGTDYLYGDGGEDTLRGGEGNDALFGGEGDDDLLGENGDDVLVGGWGADSLDGGSGLLDFADYSESSTGVIVRLFNGSGIGGDAQGDVLSNIEGVIGTDFNDTLIGSSLQTDTLNGGAGNDALFGLAGDDILSGGVGADTLDGGAGMNDVADYSDSSAGVTVRLYNGTGLGGDAQGDTLSNIESVIGSAFADVLLGSSVTDDTLNGGDGNDAIFGLAGVDTLIGGAGADVLDGGSSLFDVADYSDSGAAVIIRLFAGTGQGGDAQGDTLSGIEVVDGSDYNDVLIGFSSNQIDFLRGGIGNDQLFGLAGNDTLIGGAGADVIDGGVGNADVADYSDSDTGVAVRLYNGTGLGGHAQGDTLSNIESVIGSAFNDTLVGTFDQLDILRGGDGNDGIFGLSGNDVLFGEVGDDIIDGGSGADRINGGEGDDMLTGGAGNDSFDFVTGFGNDTITDFEDGIDVIDVSGVAGINSFADFVSVVQNGANVFITVDANNTILLENTLLADVDANDFVF